MTPWSRRSTGSSTRRFATPSRTRTTLHHDQFRSRSDWFERGGVRTSELPLDVLADVVNRALAFYDAFMREYDEQRRGYRANTVVPGRISGGPGYDPVELLADPERGLYGFRSPP